MTEFSFIEVLPQLLLLVGVLCCLLPAPKPVAWCFAALAVMAGFPAGVLDFYSILYCLALPLCLFLWVNHYFADGLRKLGLLLFLVLAGFFASHKLPGLSNFKIFDQVVFSDESTPFDMYLNFDKSYLALCLFLLLPPLERVAPWRHCRVLLLKYLTVAVVVLLPLAYMFSLVAWQPKINPYVLLWAVNNFFFVCFSEEVIFRYFIQNQLVKIFRNVQYGDLIGVFLAALLFGVAHFSGGVAMISLATVAGLLYGFIFYHTCNVRVSMTLHFMVNLIHVIFFTYPQIA